MTTSTHDFSEGFKTKVIIASAITYITGLMAFLESVFTNPICLAAF